ncbi:MAG: DNA repair protein RadA [Pseudomonadales bacterium]|nr:DNA repair protein RadA [Pseudomonadales bacterium]
MAKSQKAFVCMECGCEHRKWQGQCIECKEWNSLTEIDLTAKKNTSQQFKVYAGTTNNQLQDLASVDIKALPRISTGISELDRVLGGGLVHGSAVLMGGHPGAGKSTLLLQMLALLSTQHKALYVSGEESLAQIAMRAQRLCLTCDQLQMLTETDVAQICKIAGEYQPAVLVIDSIQVMQDLQNSSAPGSVSQVKESAAYLTRFAKQTGCILILVGHVTKEGSLAGPKVLEHMVDTSIMLEGNNDSRYRTLRSSKNRFGAVNEIGVFAMTDKGLKELKNPSAIFLSQAQQPNPGSAVTVLWEGTRPLLVEIQALVDECQFGMPQRLAVGVDQTRLTMLLAILHKHGGIMAADQDVFINVVGGIKALETSVDLAVMLAIVSSLRNQVIAQDVVIIGELGLAGEVRPVANGQERMIEAAKHGFKRAIIPLANAPKAAITGLEIVAVEQLADAIEAI